MILQYCNKILIIIVPIIVLAIAPVNAIATVSDETKRIYCNGNSLELIEQYKKEIFLQKAQPSLILADLNHILQINGIDATIVLLKELLKSTTTEAEKEYVQDMVHLFEELYLRDFSKGTHRWNIYDNIKEKMPKSITTLQYQNNTVFLSGRNTISVTQSIGGFIPLQQYTQDSKAIGLCSGSFKTSGPFTLFIYSNMDYVCYINGKKVCVNALSDKKRLIRMVHIVPDEGFTIAVYYKPVEDMFLKINFRHDNYENLNLPNAEKQYFHDIQWYELQYEYETQLITQHSIQRSAHTALQLALFYESLNSIEALKYYKEVLELQDEFIICKFLSLLLEKNDIPGSKLIVRDILKNIKCSSVLLRYFSDYLLNKKPVNVTSIHYLPLLIHVLEINKDELSNNKIDYDVLLDHYPYSNDLRYIIAYIISQYNVTKAIEILGTIPQLNDKEMTLLLDLYEQTQQFDLIVSKIESNQNNRYFGVYINALIALQRYNDAKSALFKKIAQGFDAQAYAWLATIADLEESDGSMYRQKHEIVVSQIPWHADYMRYAFDDYVKKVVFSRLAYETIRQKKFGFVYSCYALRFVDNNIYCYLYDIYMIHGISEINKYAFSRETKVTSCTIYGVNDNGEIEKKEISYKNNQLQKNIKDYLQIFMYKPVMVEVSFSLSKSIPIMHIQQNYTLSPFDMDIIAMGSSANIHVVAMVQGSVNKHNNIYHIGFDCNELSPHKERDFFIMALSHQNLIEWINEQQVFFKKADYLISPLQLNTKKIEDCVTEVANILQSYSIVKNPYIATSLLQFMYTGEGTQLDAMLYAQYMMAKNGIMSFIGVGCSHLGIHTNDNDKEWCFDTVMLYIPTSAEKGIWLTCNGTYPSLDAMTIDNVFLIVGDEIIKKSVTK
ncbi:MAG: hypothetical protein N3F66_08395 [Spirochaetes bacterium]|nr:hypothetical protein [Spirochaetota bacterium]